MILLANQENPYEDNQSQDGIYKITWPLDQFNLPMEKGVINLI